MYSEELSTGPVSSKPLRIDKDFISFDGKKIAVPAVEAYRYSQTENRVRGIRMSTSFAIDLLGKNGEEFEIHFAGLAGSTANMTRQYEKIIGLLQKLIGNPVMNRMYKSLLEGRSEDLCGCTLSPKGFGFEKKRLFRKNTACLIRWEDLDFKISSLGFLDIRSIGEEDHSVSINIARQYNAALLYALLNWMFQDSERIAMIYKANGIEY